MKKTFGLAVVLAFALGGVSSAAVATTHSCVVQKSLLWVDSEGKFQSRFAETAPFKVVTTEHETPYALSLIDKTGTSWGEVKVMTGTLLGTPEGDVVQAEAIVENPDSSIAARIATVFGMGTKFTKAMTILDLPDTDFDPNLTLSCRLIP